MGYFEVMDQDRIVVAMSGGVDSSVAAALLVRAGFRVEGAYMRTWMNEEEVFGHCPWKQDIEDARGVAEVLGIPFRVVSLMDEYRDRVVHYLLEGYRSGVTPNPDVMCNREMKFGVFRRWAMEEGFDAVATGHYVRRLAAQDGSWDLAEGLDRNKDQSYFLALLRQEQVAGARFPLGELTKPQVRRIAQDLGLPTATKKDSQGICFIGKVKMSEFMRAYVPDCPGPVVDLEGNRLGTHRGLHLVTLGQKRGVGIACHIPGHAWVVVEKRVADNTLVMGLDRPDTPGLFARRAYLSGISWVRRELGRAGAVLARPRYRSAPQAAWFEPEGDGRGWIEFEQPQRALTPGQICALYQGEVLLGGGVFARVVSDDRRRD